MDMRLIRGMSYVLAVTNMACDIWEKSVELLLASQEYMDYSNHRA